MSSKQAKAFYDSAAWQRCRDAYIAMRIGSDGGLCEVCHEQPGYIVHHKVWLNEDNINNPKITLNFDNLRYECLDCHNLERPDGTMEARTPKLRFDFNGDPLPP